MMQKLLYNFEIAVAAILQNKVRGLLTSLGIIFGVASVITMLAIGRGAQEEILEQMKILGTNNIIVKPVLDDERDSGSDDNQVTGKGDTKRWSPGLTLADARSIMEVVPHVESVSPEVIDECTAFRPGFKKSAKLVGIASNFAEITGFELATGNFFSVLQIKHAEPVCIIGAGIRSKLFPREDPIGKKIKCGRLWLTVIGIARERKISEKNIQKLGIRDYNKDIYVPVNTFLLRYLNRSLANSKQASKQLNVVMWGAEATAPSISNNYNQLDQIIVRVDETKRINAVAEILGRMLVRRHNNVEDVEVVVPELLLKQEQRTRDIFNIVLSSIASISLIVGGIGIMNIMLASILERIREIGVRLSVGATRRDIILQFLSESTALCIAGGVIGIILGIMLSYIIEEFTGIATVITFLSILVSFLVAVAVGLASGLFPAVKAAQQDPVTSLRYE